MARFASKSMKAAGFCFAGLAIALSAQVLAQQAATQPATAPARDEAKYLRVVEDKGKSISLQIASRDFKRADGTGPRVGLIAVAHIADRSFYRAVERLLKEYEVVLFESVKPPGTGGAGGATDEERIGSTKAAMGFVGGLIERFKVERDSYPANLESLREFAKAEDARLLKFVDPALKDAWGRQFVYELRAPTPAGVADAAVNVEQKPETFSLTSLGADGREGGEGANADVKLSDQKPPSPLALSSEDGLQSQLADALGLEFQLDSLPYDEANWRCSDMAVDEVARRMKRHGMDFEEIGGTLAGTSLPAQMVKVFLSFLRFADAMADGAITDVIKVVMIEVLGDEKLIEQGLDQFGKGFSEVIVGDRNQVAIDDLKTLIEKEPEVKSVAVLYGAAHMPDMEKKLAEQLGYAPANDAEPHWLPAIRVDLSKSAMSQRELRQIRVMIKQTLREQMRAK